MYFRVFQFFITTMSLRGTDRYPRKYEDQSYEREVRLKWWSHQDATADIGCKDRYKYSSFNYCEKGNGVCDIFGVMQHVGDLCSDF